MKKIFSSLAVLAILFTAVACNNSPSYGAKITEGSTISWDTTKSDGTTSPTSFKIQLTNGAKFDDGEADADEWFSSTVTGVSKLSFTTAVDGSDASIATVTVDASSLTAALVGKFSILIPQSHLLSSDGKTGWTDGDVVLPDAIEFKLTQEAAVTASGSISGTAGGTSLTSTKITLTLNGGVTTSLTTSSDTTITVTYTPTASTGGSAPTDWTCKANKNSSGNIELTFAKGDTALAACSGTMTISKTNAAALGLTLTNGYIIPDDGFAIGSYTISAN